MNVDFSPKKQFQSNDKLRKELTVVVTSDAFHQALSFALSEFVSRHTPSADQTAAVRNFINTLLYLPVESAPMPVFPTKTLDHTVYTTTQPTQTVKGHHD